MQVLDPLICYVTLGKCHTFQPQFPHLNNEMIEVAQWFSTPAVKISSSRQDGVNFPPEVTKNHRIMKQWFTRCWTSGNEGEMRNR